MLEKRLREILNHILKESQYDVATNYYLVIVPNERTSLHGKFMYPSNRIYIYNLSRPTNYILSTTIHEISHFVEYSLHGETGHSKRFYEIYHHLLNVAISYGYINYDIARKASDVRDIKMLEKYFGIPTAIYGEKCEKRYYIISIKNCYAYKENLKILGYKFNGIESTWEKEVLNENIEQEKVLLQSFKDIVVNIENKENKEIVAIYYLEVSGNTYECKDKLKALGYIYNGYGSSNNVWVKKIEASTYEKEMLKLEGVENIKIKIRNKNKPTKKRA